MDGAVGPDRARPRGAADPPQPADDPSRMSSDLTLEALEKRFGDSPIIRGVSLAVRPSEIVALLGPSGSGKTTVLRLVAGFERPDAAAFSSRERT